PVALFGGLFEIAHGSYSGWLDFGIARIISNAASASLRRRATTRHASSSTDEQQRLYLIPLLHQQGSLRPGVGKIESSVSGSISGTMSWSIICAAPHTRTTTRLARRRRPSWSSRATARCREESGPPQQRAPRRFLRSPNSRWCSLRLPDRRPNLRPFILQDPDCLTQTDLGS